MIEFSGPLTGTARSAFIRKQKQVGAIILFPVFLFTLLNIFLIGKVVLHDDAFIYAMLIALFVSAVILFIPKGKNEFSSTLPKKVYADSRRIVCISEQRSETKLISDVRKVVDHGEYYEVFFTFGKGSNCFICQKNLLTKGSLTKFESLLNNKIIKSNSMG